MGRRPAFAPRDEIADRIRKLEDELYIARESIIDLAPDRFHELLKSYLSCKTRMESYHWANSIAEKIAEDADPIADLPGAAMFGARGYCPLCRGGAQSFYATDRGFRLPEGLRRHLVGFGNTHQCVVMKAAEEQGRRLWDSSFSEQEAKEEQLESRTKAIRLATETLYVLGPTAEGVLVDDIFLRRCRVAGDEAYSLTWAEQRLFSLGFLIGVDGNKRSYTRVVKHASGEFLIYADPRRLGAIDFRIYDAAVKKGKKKDVSLHTFNIRDAWKNNLPHKVAAAIEAAATSSRR